MNVTAMRAKIAPKARWICPAALVLSGFPVEVPVESLPVADPVEVPVADPVEEVMGTPLEVAGTGEEVMVLLGLTDPEVRVLLAPVELPVELLEVMLMTGISRSRLKEAERPSAAV